MIIYLLHYDNTDGDSESWNTFYTPCEAYSTAELREARKAELKQIDSDYEFVEEDLEVDHAKQTDA
jgi:hypothetical protein